MNRCRALAIVLGLGVLPMPLSANSSGLAGSDRAQRASGPRSAGRTLLAQTEGPVQLRGDEPASIQGDAQGEGQGQGQGQGGGFFYLNKTGEAARPSESTLEQADSADDAPDVHVVRSGDTLWDISDYYFRDPWQWPRLWAQNPTITNPHWIYPGDLVRLSAVSAAPEPLVAPAPVVGEPAPSPVVPQGIEIRQLAFVSADDLKYAGTIVGSSDAKELLSKDDTVFVDYPQGQPPQVGRRYAVYSEQKKVVHPKTKKLLGAYVVVKGEVTVLDVKKDRRARGLITYSHSPAERGERVGPARTQFKQVPPVKADRDLEGLVVDTLNSNVLVGAEQIVFLDRGSAQGVRVGNRFAVVRRGDALVATGGRDVGQNDLAYPEGALGDIVILDVGKDTSLGVVRYSSREFEIGDRVVMRKGH